MDERWPLMILIFCIAIVVLGLSGGAFYYNIIKLEHQTERLTTLEGVDRCLYLCGDVSNLYSEEQIICFEKCEDNYVNLETLKLVTTK